MRKTPIEQITHRVVCAALVALVAVVSASCGEVARTGRSPAFIIIDSLEAAPGDDDTTFGQILQSDVSPVFNDVGRAQFRLGLKNPGTAAAPTSPSTLNDITLTRYRVTYTRTDGRNTQGVDVPFSFDGALTVTIPSNGTTAATFDVVRHQAKLEPPLLNLRRGGGARVFNAIAEITFYGRDQAGNNAQASGLLTIVFSDFADDE